MKAFSLCWRSSTKARKQRKYIVNAPLHIRHRFVSMHLSPELRKKHGTRNLPARKGDTIKILRGSLAGRTGKIDHIEDEKIFVGGIENTRKDGSKSLIPPATKQPHAHRNSTGRQEALNGT